MKFAWHWQLFSKPGETLNVAKQREYKIGEITLEEDGGLTGINKNMGGGEAK